MNDNLFGTDGMRQRVGISPFTLTELPRLGYAIGSWIVKRYGTHAHILIAHDTRASANFVQAALTSGLLMHPLTIIHAGLLSTPAVAALLQTSSVYTLGIVISASHNPYQDNGIKLIEKKHGKIEEADEQIISDLFRTAQPDLSYGHFGNLIQAFDLEEQYSNHVIAHFPQNFLRNITVVLDCAHGATYRTAPHIFSALGAQVIIIANQPNGSNINEQCGALHPTQLQEAVIAHNADIGFAFDGDGDRVIAVNGNGVIKNGDDMLMILSQHQDYIQQKNIVATIMSNHGLVVALTLHGKDVQRCQVGDKYVLAELKQKNALLGGEQSGHIIMRNYLPMGDGIYTALKIAQTLIHTNNWNMDTFHVYPQTIANIPITIKKNLQEPCLAQIIALYESQLAEGRMVIRYSGTENVLRIMIENNDLASAHYIIKQLSQALAQQLCTQ